jgi:hypothetical protein
MDTFQVEGSLWRVSQFFDSSDSHTLVIPKPYHAGPANIGNQVLYDEFSVVIKGFAINFVASGAATVSLVSLDPWVGDGDHDKTDIIYQWTVGAGQYMQVVTPCEIPLSKGGYRNSYSSPSAANGAKLALTTGTGITNGFLVAWGIHTQYGYGRHAETSSPADFTT